MALFLRQDNEQSELQTKVAADLKERLKHRPIETVEHEPAFTENRHETRPAGVVLVILLVILATAATVWAFRRGGMF